jgi:hypothetical protein
MNRILRVGAKALLLTGVTLAPGAGALVATAANTGSNNLTAAYPSALIQDTGGCKGTRQGRHHTRHHRAQRHRRRALNPQPLPPRLANRNTANGNAKTRY